MAMLALLPLVFCAGLLGSANAAIRSAIGTPVPIEDFPSIVQVDFRGVGSGIWFQSCAGSILNSRYFLSSANCFHGITYDPNNRRIRAGSADRDNGGSLSYVQVAYNHPSFGRLGNDGDISVVRLINPLVYSDTTLPGVIAAQGTQLYGGLPIVHAGWGATIQQGSASEVLLRNDIYTIDNQWCKERYEGLSIPEHVTENMMCVGFLGAVEENACLGDFGGPMYYHDSNFGNIIVGLVSWGHGCSNGTFPGVCTSVGQYSDWIVSVAV